MMSMNLNQKKEKFKYKLAEQLQRNNFLYLALFYAIILKLITIQMIGTDGDSGHAWIQAKHLLFGSDYIATHISTRYGKIFPALLYLKIFGTHPIVYYFAPITFYIITIIFLFKNVLFITKSNQIAFWTAFIFSLFPNIIEAGNQLKPAIFSMGYLLISIYSLFKYLENKEKYWLLLVSCLFLFFAYSAKMTNILFLPGFALVMLIDREKFKNIIIYCSILFLLFIIETLIYRNVFNAEFGRISIVAGTHLSGNQTLQPVQNIFYLFKRFIEVRAYWYPLFLISIPGAVYIYLKEKNRFIRYFTIIFGSFLLLLTFAVKSITPLTLALPFVERYFNIILPFLFTIFVLLISYPVNKLKVAEYQNNFKRYVIFVLSFLLIGTTVYQYIYINIAYPSLKGSNFSSNYPLKEVFRFYSELNDEYKNGTPIIIPKTVMERYRNPYEKVNNFVDNGITLQNACDKIGITEEYYRYCERRVTRGDFKAAKNFIYFFLNYEETLVNNKFQTPKQHEIIFNNWIYNIIIKDNYYDGSKEGSIKYLEKSKKHIVLDVKPFRAFIVTKK